jgi:hypothetical protein
MVRAVGVRERNRDGVPAGSPRHGDVAPTIAVEVTRDRRRARRPRVELEPRIAARLGKVGRVPPAAVAVRDGGRDVVAVDPHQRERGVAAGDARGGGGDRRREHREVRHEVRRGARREERHRQRRVRALERHGGRVLRVDALDGEGLARPQARREVGKVRPEGRVTIDERRRERLRDRGRRERAVVQEGHELLQRRRERLHTRPVSVNPVAFQAVDRAGTISDHM